MSLNIKEITETLEFNKEDLKGNRQLTNEMIIDDIMLGLGYNKRRDRSIQRLFDGLIDWIVTTNSGKKVAVKVLAYNECIEEANDTKETIQYCLNARYSILLIITGLILRVLRYDKKELNYVHVTDIKLDTDLSVEDQKLVTAISKDTFDIEYIDSLIKCSVTYTDFINTIKNNIGTVTNTVQGLIENSSTEIIQGYLDKLVNNTEVTSSVESSSEELDRAVQALSDANKKLNDANETINSLTNDKEILTKELDKAKDTINELKMESFSNESSSEELNAKDEEIERLKEENKQLLSNIEQLKKSGSGTGDNSQDIQNKMDSYVQQIRDLSVQLSDAKEEKDKALADLEEMKKEVEELSGSDLKFAERLLETADSDPEDDRSYVAVINKELLNYEDIHTFIGRCLQKLYDLKSFDAQRYIFDGDIFELDKNARFADVVMGNNTYDILLKTNNENEELNKLRTVFSHFDDVTFVCKKIGTLRKDINNRYGVPEEKEVIQLESDDYIPEDTEYNEQQVEENYEMPSDTSNELFGTEGNIDSNDIFGDGDDADSSDLFGEEENTFGDREENTFEDREENYEMPDDTSDGLFGESEQAYSEGNTFENTFGVEQTLDDNQEYTEESFDEQEYSEENQIPTKEFEGEQQIPYFDEETEMPAEMENHLLVGQLMNIDMLIWSEENVKFKNIKYISTNIITFGISNQVDSYDKLLCKCIDAVFAIEAFNGSKDLVYTIKQKDFSVVNNFIKVYSPEYAQYPRINGTRFVVAGIESVQQVAAALLDICNLMGISTEEIFLYFETETNSQYIIENFDFDENAIRIAETNSYIPEEGVTPHEAIAIIKGDMFNHIVITKNSLKVHKEIFNKALAVKTKYLGLVIESNDNVYEIIGDIIEAAHRENINIDYRTIGNVIGESYMLVSNNESKVADNHVSMTIGGENIYISRVEDWQVPHSLIKVHTAIFNNTAIAVKSSVNADAINFYGQQFDTSEPSLGLAVNSFVDYVASCIKE